MCDHDHNEPAMPPEPATHQIPDPRGFAHIDPDILAWVLMCLAGHPVDAHIELVVCYGQRASGEGMDRAVERQVPHHFVAVLDDAAPDDLLAGRPGHAAFMDEMNAAAREANTVGVDVMFCHRNRWAGRDGNDDGLLKMMRRGMIVAARL